VRPLLIDLDHGVVCVDSGYQRPGLAAVYLVVEGGRAAVIDTGTANSTPNVLHSLERHGVSPESVAYVMPTHVHLDHAGGAGILAETFANARIVVHPRGFRHLVDPTRLIESATAVYGESEFERLFGTLTPVPEDRITLAEDGMVLDLNGRGLRILDSPGHARHHYSVYDERRHIRSELSRGRGWRDGLCLPHHHTRPVRPRRMGPDTRPLSGISG
jgi:glyoxylase-like metal-dependent hydrolase (beta-lactamase superfamily II)